MRVKPISHYQQFIQQELENLAAEVKQEISKPAEQTKDDDDTMSITSKGTEGTEGTEIEIEEEGDDEDQIRAVSFPFQSLLREDLPEDIRQTFIDTLEATVRSSVDSGELTFSEPDNGYISMTELVGLSIDRFRFHLQLYNRFSPLIEGNINDK